MQIDIEFKIDKKKYLIGMQIDIEDKIDNKKYLIGMKIKLTKRNIYWDADRYWIENWKKKYLIGMQIAGERSIHLIDRLMH